MLPSRQSKRFRPRFAIRTLVILVTLVCAYAACWGPTKTQGQLDVYWHEHDRDVLAFHQSTIAPLLIRVEGRDILQETESDGTVYVTQLGSLRRVYYFWFFGYVAKLYERPIDSLPLTY